MLGDVHRDGPFWYNTHPNASASFTLSGVNCGRFSVHPKDEIAPPDLEIEHPELYHYTDLVGLKGIFLSNTLWATHFRHLNDLSEVTLLKQSITKSLIPRALQANASMALGRSRHARRSLMSAAKLDGVKRVVLAFIDALFAVAFEGTRTEALAEPYITSFCAHPPSQRYERENGLLSQWRAYGGGERYCLVFETAAVMRLLNLEFARYHWTYIYLDKVCYDDPDLDVASLFPDLLNLCEEAIVRTVKGQGVDAHPDVALALLSAAPWVKHQGFREEQEARVVAIPTISRIVDIEQQRAPNSTLSLKPIVSRETPQGDCPYLVLFDRLDERLPIKRVIVGPSRHQAENLERARSVIGGRVPLFRSKTPFLG
jgi:hypothetical protein